MECGREGLGLDGGGIDESMGKDMDPEYEGGSSQSSASASLSEDRQTLELLDENFKMPQIRHAALLAACRCCEAIFETTAYGCSLPDEMQECQVCFYGYDDPTRAP